MLVVERFRLWLFPPASRIGDRATQAPQMEDGMTPMVTAADIPPERRALLLEVQHKQHEIIGRLTAARLRRQMAEQQRHEQVAE